MTRNRDPLDHVEVPADAYQLAADRALTYAESSGYLPLRQAAPKIQQGNPIPPTAEQFFEYAQLRLG